MGRPGPRRAHLRDVAGPTAMKKLPCSSLLGLLLARLARSGVRGVKYIVPIRPPRSHITDVHRYIRAKFDIVADADAFGRSPRPPKPKLTAGGTLAPTNGTPRSNLPPPTQRRCRALQIVDDVLVAELTAGESSNSLTISGARRLNQSSWRGTTALTSSGRCQRSVGETMGRRLAWSRSLACEKRRGAPWIAS